MSWVSGLTTTLFSPTSNEPLRSRVTSLGYNEGKKHSYVYEKLDTVQHLSWIEVELIELVDDELIE